MPDDTNRRHDRIAGAGLQRDASGVDSGQSGADDQLGWLVVYADDDFALITPNGVVSNAGTVADLDSYGVAGTFTVSAVTYTVKKVASNQNLFDYVFKEYSVFYDGAAGINNNDFQGDQIREAGSDIIKVSIDNIKSRKIKSKISQEGPFSPSLIKS